LVPARDALREQREHARVVRENRQAGVAIARQVRLKSPPATTDGITTAIHQLNLDDMDQS